MTSPAETIATLKIKLYWQERDAHRAHDKWEVALAVVTKLKAQIAELEAQQLTEDAQ